MYNDVKDPLFIKVKSYMYTKSLKEFRPIIINLFDCVMTTVMVLTLCTTSY